MCSLAAVQLPLALARANTGVAEEDLIMFEGFCLGALHGRITETASSGLSDGCAQSNPAA